MSHNFEPKVSKASAAIQNWLVSQLSELLGIEQNEIDITQPFTYYGLCSAEAVILSADLEQWLGHPVPPTLAWDYPTIEAAACYLAGEKPVRAVTQSAVPQAYVYPAEMRATRDLLRRRMHCMRKRAALLPHVQNTNSQYNLPESGQKIAYKANRNGGAERFTDPAVQKSIEVDRALLGHYDELLRDIELSVLKAAKQHDANALSLLRTVPGIGEILSLVLLYEIHDIQRFPRVQDFAAYCRLVKCAKESGGKGYGTSGTKIGNAYLKWAFSEAAVLFLRANPAGQKYLSRLEKKHGKGKALTVLAHKLARAVYYMLQRTTVFDMHKFLTG
jgi:acyl carrier protein